MWWTIAAAVVIALVVVWMVMKPPPNVGDRSKLERTFSAAEQHRIESRKVTAQQLGDATCEDGQACWIVVDGIVYDMGGFPKWARGRHHGVEAGQDCTEAFVGSGHALAVLQNMPVVGGYDG